MKKVIRNISKVFFGGSDKKTDTPAAIRPNLPLLTKPQLQRILFKEDLFLRIKDIPGSIVECGVGQGWGLATLLCLLLNEGRNRRIWAFDSFEGFPKLAAEDDASPAFEASLAEYGQFTIPYVRKSLIDFGHSPADIDSKIAVVKGFIPDTLKNYDGSPIALLYVDLDIYEGYRDSLAYFWNIVVPGGVIAFDEYTKPLDAHKWPGAARAINEFLDARGLRPLLQFDPRTGNAFIIKPSS